MNKKEELKRIIDNLPDEKLPDPIEFLKSLIPEDDEPLTDEELKAIKEAEKRIANGEYTTLEELLKDLDGDD
ncbi:hypothetical protein [Fictibacillus gelatini]|uniref:hypothetical protein n=1 Tax=Fictibacillus gelatini TaxID=225985 RepID=UPI000419724F|nr:hypothetical protein [Fictibacillus gelatini]